MHKGVFAQFETGLISESQFYDEIRKLSDKMISDSQIKDAWLSMTTDIPTYKLDKILELKKDYNVFLLSNTNILHWQKAKNYEFSKRGFSVEDYFHKIWLSYEINLMKPSDEIFEFILKDSGMNPEQTLLIDDAEMNCQTAEKFGIKTYMPTHKEDRKSVV